MKSGRTKGLYTKARPSDPTRRDWYAKVWVGANREPFSLCLAANVGNKEVNVREAETRFDALKAEIAAGKLTSVVNWMQPEQVNRLNHKMALSRLNPTDDRPRTWDEAGDKWLATYRAKLVTEVQDKINVTHAADKQRERYLNEFLKFVKVQGTPIEGVNIDRLFIGFFKSLEDRRNGHTIDNQFSYMVLFGEYLAKQGLCPKPNREAIRERFPPKPPVHTVVPHWQEDLTVMRALFAHRHESPGLWSAWTLFLIVRGLGCRPDESIHLSWNTMFLESGRVVFPDTKENRRQKRGSRSVPILFEWVHEGLRELMDVYKRRQPEIPVVCLTRLNSFFASQQTMCDTFRYARKTLGLPESYGLKRAQKCHIEQLRSLRVPDSEIAVMTGHTMETYFKHYVKQKTFDRLDRHDYAEFGTLCENGVYWFKEWNVPINGNHA